VVNPEQLGGDTPPRFTFRYLDISSVTEGSIDWSTVTEHQFQTAPSRARRVVRKGDILLCTVRPGLQSHAHADWSESARTICSTGFAVIRCGGQVDSRYLGKLIFHDVIAGQLRALEVGSSYPAVNEVDVRSLQLWLPPISDQRRIADILDAADAAIRQTAVVVAKLRQVKAGLHHDLLTRGLDGRGRLRNSAHDPNHYRETSLGDLTPLRRERGRPGLPVVAVTMRDGLQPRDPTERRVETRLGPEQHLLARRGDIAYNMMRMWQGACGLAAEDCILSPAYVVLAPKDAVPGFVYRLFKLPETIQQFHRLSRGLTDDRLRLYHRDFARIVVRVPKSLAEQHTIVDRLDAHDERIRTEEASLAKLKLQKRGLMNDLLTGRVRV